MNAYPNTAAVNQALTVAGLAPERANLTDGSLLNDFVSRCREAGVTPGGVMEIASSL